MKLRAFGTVLGTVTIFAAGYGLRATADRSEASTSYIRFQNIADAHGAALMEAAKLQGEEKDKAVLRIRAQDLDAKEVARVVARDLDQSRATLVGILDKYGEKVQLVDSSAQASQLSGECSLQLQALQVAQNARIIDLLEQVAAHGK